jgi:hypothetical protein
MQQMDVSVGKAMYCAEYDKTPTKQQLFARTMRKPQLFSPSQFKLK